MINLDKYASVSIIPVPVPTCEASLYALINYLKIIEGWEKKSLGRKNREGEHPAMAVCRGRCKDSTEGCSPLSNEESGDSGCGEGAARAWKAPG